MESRNLIKFGNSSYVVSLPKKWVENNKLKKGDSVFIEQNGNKELIIMPSIIEIKDIDKKITIDVNDKDIELIKREMVSAYINNYKTIKLIAKDIREKRAGIKEIVNNLVAVEIIEENDKEIIISDFLNINDVYWFLFYKVPQNDFASSGVCRVWGLRLLNFLH